MPLDDEQEGGTANSWIQAVDRGGLTQVNEMTFKVFLAMEKELRKHLGKPGSFDLEQLYKFVMSDDDVLFYWAIVGGDLKLFADSYIRIRGFSCANAWMERFNSANTILINQFFFYCFFFTCTLISLNHFN